MKTNYDHPIREKFRIATSGPKAPAIEAAKMAYLRQEVFEGVPETGMFLHTYAILDGPNNPVVLEGTQEI